MKISRIDNSYNFSFNKKFKTEDVLKTLTEFDFRKKNADEFVKEISGIDVSDEALNKTLDDKCNTSILKYAIQDLCADEMMKQDERLIEVRNSYNNFIDKFGIYGYNKERFNGWFDEQMKKLGKTIDLEPFVITKEKIKEQYEFLYDILRYY